MACIQASGSAEAYHAKHKSVATEMCTIAQNMAHKHGGDQGVTVDGCIMNNANGTCINFFTKHEWPGQPWPQPNMYPPSIAKGSTAAFSQGDKCNDEAAVVYADGAGAGWLLAWSVKDDTNPNKVYVETRPIEYYKHINWDLIKAKLDASSNASYYRDPSNGNEAIAKISQGNNAALGAYYTVSKC